MGLLVEEPLNNRRQSYMLSEMAEVNSSGSSRVDSTPVSS
jgi:hypothetical protein